MFLTTHALTFIYEDSAIPALDSLDAAFSKGWTGIVGENGSGKTTLLMLLCGISKPTRGSISPDLRGTYCAQSTEVPPPNMMDFALDYSNDSVRLRSLLAIEDEWFWRFDTLSHGERKRIQIGCALNLAPPLLALDEPTNHLDASTRDIVLSALRTYRGVGLLVSHDRLFLDELTYQCLFFKSGKATMIPGTYSEGREQIELRNKTKAAERKHAKEELARLQVENNRRRAVADRSAARRSAKGIDKHDNDARAKINLAIFTGQDGKTGLLSSQMDKKIEFAHERLDKVKVEKSYDKPLEFTAEPAKRKVLIHEEGGSIALGEKKVLRYPDVFVGNIDRIGFQGNNGTGKSTFLTHLLRDSERDEKILLIPQEMTEEEGKAVLEKIKGLSQSELGQILSIVARLNSPPERILSGGDLSPGELRKVMLACGLIGSPHLIVMDEPTNHLDIHSIEALQNVLEGCSCALLLVSHDERFLDALTDIRWVFEPASRSDAHGKDTTCAESRPQKQATRGNRGKHPGEEDTLGCFDEGEVIELKVVLR